MTDEELARLAKTDKVAQEKLLNKYIPLVKSISARFFLQGGDADDLSQEGMVGLYSAINSFEPHGANFSSYAYTCIRNAVLDAVKRNNGAKNSALNNSVPILEIGGEFSPASPEDELLLSENRREFMHKISRHLSALEFKAIVMCLDGMSVSEISSALAKPQKSVSNALSRAKSKLQKIYTEET